MESKEFQEFRISGGAGGLNSCGLGLWLCSMSEGLDMLSCPWSFGQRGIGVVPALVIY